MDYKRFHGVDKHSTFLTITILDRNGELVKRISRCTDFNQYISSLNDEDAVVIEAGNRTFYLADLMEAQGAKVFIINPAQFKQIINSKKKTDKNDSKTLAAALVHSLVSNGFFQLPLVFKPKANIRELRRMFSTLDTLNNCIVKLKNSVIGEMRDSGVDNKLIDGKIIFNEALSEAYLNSIGIFQPTKMAVTALLIPLFACQKERENLRLNIVVSGKDFQKEIELLMSIKGISPLSSLAFIADVGDIRRFKNQRSLCAYLGVVPMVKQSGSKEHKGHIIRQSRKLTRTLLTQSVVHLQKGSPYIEEWYVRLKERRGGGKSRIAIIRKTICTMRRMLLDDTLFEHVDMKAYEIKLKKYRDLLAKVA